MRKLEDFIYPTQGELFNLIRSIYGADAISRKGAYILVKGEAPVLLLAHMDTVHKNRVKYICKSEDGNILMSPQGIGGDDRCGVYSLVTAREQSDVKPWLLFTCDEEIGGKGAGKFASDYAAKRLPKALDSLKLLIEIDRRGKNDAVYYDCENYELEDYITGKGFETDYGSFSDISVIAPEMGIAAVNLSSGYYNAHTTHEYINRKHLAATVERVVEIVRESCAADFPRFEYMEADPYYMGGAWGLAGRERYAPKDLPGKYAAWYEELLYYYTPDELDDLRACYGDKVIRELYESEFGPDVPADGGSVLTGWEI